MEDLIHRLMNWAVRFFNTIQKNWLYLILAFAAPLLLYYVAQGDEITLCLYNEDQSLNLLIILTSFIVLFYFIWVIPVWSIELVMFILSFKKSESSAIIDTIENIPVSRRGIFASLATFYNGDGSPRSVFPIRNFANIPLLIFVYMLFAMNWPTLQGLEYFLVFLIISIIINNAIRDYVINTIFARMTETPYWGYLGHALFILLAAFFWMWNDNSSFQSLAIGCMWLLYMYNDLYHYFIETKKPEGNKELQPDKEDFYDKSRNVFTVYVIIMAAGLIIIALAQWFDYLHKISPVIIMNLCFGFFIVLLDVIFKTPRDIFLLLKERVEKEDIEIKKKQLIYKSEAPIPVRKSKIKQLYAIFNFLNVVLVVLSIQTIFLKSINSHKIHKVRISHEEFERLGKRDSLHTYFEKWAALNNPDTVYLVTAQGGGSRAGFWTGMILDSMSKKDTNFRKNLFAISSVSGSTSGTNMYLTKRYLQNQGILPDISGVNNQHIPKFWNRIYSYNYLSSGLWGLLLSDGIRGYFTKNADFDKDRNYYHEKDEINALKNCYTIADRQKVIDVMSADYMYKWQDSTQGYTLPLHLINSANTQEGNRLIICPYIFDPQVHPSSKGLYNQFRDSLIKYYTQQFAFPMTTCVKVSQSFPLISAYYWLPGTGNLIDGGLYENTGSNSMYEMYVYLKKLYPGTIFKVIFLLNSIDKKKKIEPVNSVVLNTLSSLSSTPFTGHSEYWYKKLKQELTVNGDAFQIIQPGREYPLAILLSKKTLDSLYAELKPHL